MSPYDALIHAVEVATGRQGRRVGKETRLLCPAHDDHNPSLDISEAQDGTPLVHCRSCGAGLPEVARALGKEPGVYLNGNGREEWTPHGPAVAIYDYVDEDGHLLFQVCRTADKQFPQRRPDSSKPSGWAWKLGDTRRVLYRLPEVITAARTGEPLYITEGEKDAESIRKTGATATCNPGGAGKWRDEYVAFLKGADLTIVADKDEAGIAHARKIAASTGSTRIVQAKAGKDVTEHLAAGLTLADLEPVELDPYAFRLRVETAPEIIAIPDPPDSDLLLGPLVIRGARTIIVGDTGHGKTTFTLQMAAAVLTGRTMLDYQGAGEGPILVIDLEQGTRSIKRTIREAGLHDSVETLYVRQPDGLSLGDDAEHLAEVHRVIEENLPTIVVLDPFYKAHRGDPNEERPITELMRIFDALRDKFGFALLMPAHPRKEAVASGGVRKLTIHDVSGSAAIVRGAEVILGIERVSHGYARLRPLKDRDGDLPVGEAWPLIFERGDGFRLDPKEETKVEDIETLILKDTGDWKTPEQWRKQLGIRKTKAKEVLDRLVVAGLVEFAFGAGGRHHSAHCYRPVPNPREHQGTPGPALVDNSGVPTVPTSIGDVDMGTGEATVPEPGTLEHSADDDIPWPDTR